MGVAKRTFQSAGQISQHLIPGAYSRIDSVKGAVGLVSVNNGVLMGQCTGGEPTTLLQFNNLSDAVRTLKSGALMEAMRLAFNPGPGYVPQKLYAMRVNSAVQGHGHLLNGANPMVKLLSRDYGLDMNQINFKIEAGTTAGKKLTLTYKGYSEVHNNIQRQSFSIAYSGGACTMTITNNTTPTHTLTTSAGGLSISLADYPTIGALVAYINTVTNFTAAVIAGQSDASSLLLDNVTALDISTSKTVESTLQAIIDEVNDYSGICTAEDESGTTGRLVPALPATATYFTGGSEGSYTGTEWTNALTALEAEDVQFVSTPDSSASVHAAIKTHCETMSAVAGRKERQFLVGGAWGDSVATATAAAAVLNSYCGLYAYNGITQRDVNGVIQNYSASYVACMLLGMACTVAINMPLTFKMLSAISLESKLKDSDLETLIAGGVCPTNYNSSGVAHCVRQVTSYQADDLKYNEFSVVKEMFFVSRDLRNYLEGLFVGQPGTLVDGVIKGAVENRLTMYLELGVFVTGDEGAFWNVSLSLVGDQLIVDYDAYITCPINFIFITNHFHEVVSTAA